MFSISHDTAEFVLTTSIYIILFYIVLSVFYFVHVSGAEEHHILELAKEVSSLDPNDGVESELETAIIAGFRAITTAKKAELLKNANDSARVRNEKNTGLMWKCGYIGAGMFIALALLNYYILSKLAKANRPCMTTVFIETLVMVAILSAIEIGFYFIIVKQYIHTSQDEMTYTVVSPYFNKLPVP